MTQPPDAPRKPAAAEEPLSSPMQHPEEPTTGVEGPPRFGRLLLVLAAAVLVVGMLAIGMAAWLGP